MGIASRKIYTIYNHGEGISRNEILGYRPTLHMLIAPSGLRTYVAHINVPEQAY